VSTELTIERFLQLVSGRTGHFRMESGYHSGLWLDLDALFVNADVAPYVDRLAERLGRYPLDAICGPLLGGAFLAQEIARQLSLEFWYTTPSSPANGEALFRARYALPRALEARASGRRVAVVDDLMSAGSSIRATVEALRASGSEVVAVGALAVLGSVGASHFAALGLPVEAAVRGSYSTWHPDACPLCADGVAIEAVAGV
jgi:orotate phosphoribosyltransferase